MALQFLLFFTFVIYLSLVYLRRANDDPTKGFLCGLLAW